MTIESRGQRFGPFPIIVVVCSQNTEGACFIDTPHLLVIFPSLHISAFFFPLLVPLLL